MYQIAKFRKLLEVGLVPALYARVAVEVGNAVRRRRQDVRQKAFAMFSLYALFLELGRIDETLEHAAIWQMPVTDEKGLTAREKT